MEKSEAMEYYIGYPDELLNDTLIAEYYQELNIADDSYFQNALNSRTFRTNKSYKKLREPVDKKDWKRHSKTAIINAFYSVQDNSISKCFVGIAKAKSIVARRYLIGGNSLDEVVKIFFE